jgi:predicted Zn-dependent peptidase
MMIGYKRPSLYDKDDPVFDVISGILSSGRTGKLYKELVRDKRIALAAQAADNFPGALYPNTFLFFLVPSAGKTVEENEKALYDVLERFKSEKVDAETLQRVKTKTRASLIRRLDSNAGLAGLLTTYHAIYGDWRKLFTSLNDLDRVTADDVQRVARAVFVDRGKTVAYTQPPAEAAKAAGGAK